MKLVFRWIVFAFFSLTVASAAQALPAAQKLVEKALAAQGGQERLNSARAVRLHAMLRKNALEQSVRPDGPWFEAFSDTIFIRRFDQPALWKQARSRGYQSDWWTSSRWTESTSLIVDGTALVMRNGSWVPGLQNNVRTAEESLALGPERALLTAFAAPDLRIAPSEVLRGQKHDIVSFSWNGAPVRIWLTPISHMPAAVEITRPKPMDLYWLPWGDVSTRVEWDAWTLEPEGWRYPRLWTIYQNDQIEQVMMIDQVEINPEIPAELYSVPAQAITDAIARRNVIADIHFSGEKSIEVAPGIWLYPGFWNIVMVEQPNGIYIIEAPISNSYSSEVLAHARDSGRNILGLITTSDSWPHIGGLRQYVAEEVPVTVLDLNRPLLERLLSAPFHQIPDALSRTPKAAKVTVVEKPLALGAGEHEMRLLPFRTVTGERQMAIYWPARKLLYTSDIMTPLENAIWLPQYREEVRELILREHLDVQTVFGVHYDPVEWASLSSLPAPQGQ